MSDEGYTNPGPSYKRPSVADIWASISLRCLVNRPYVPSLERIPETQRANFKFPVSSPHPRAMWLGHASIVLQLPPVERDMLKGPIGVLFDPIFSKRCSPVSWVRPKRRLGVPCHVRDLPKVNVVVISHDHCESSLLVGLFFVE